MKLSEVFRTILPQVEADADRGITKGLCFSLDAARDAQQISFCDCSRAKLHIQYLLGDHLTLLSWLAEYVPQAHVQLMAMPSVERFYIRADYRLRWLRHIIETLEGKGR